MEEQKLLKGTTSLGSKVTHREEARQQLFLERAGIQETLETAPPTAPVGKKKNRKKTKAQKQSMSAQPVGARIITVAQSSDSSEGESEEEAEGDKVAAEEMEVDPKEEEKEEKEESPEVKTAVSEPAKQATENWTEKRNKALSKVDDSKTTFTVRVDRDPEVQAKRQELPVCLMEQEIMEKISANPVTVLCGETGSGKTTQVPQFLIEAGYGCPDAPDPAKRGMVAVTQPRRVATVSMAERVGAELGTSNKESELFGAVGYQIRHDSSTLSSRTRLKFMTDGVLLREAKEDLLLRRYSVIILDEAHERNLNTDILLGLLSRIVPLRAEIHREGSMPDVYPLRVVIMSATPAC